MEHGEIVVPVITCFKYFVNECLELAAVDTVYFFRHLLLLSGIFICCAF